MILSIAIVNSYILLSNSFLRLTKKPKYTTQFHLPLRFCVIFATENVLFHKYCYVVTTAESNFYHFFPSKFKKDLSCTLPFITFSVSEDKGDDSSKVFANCSHILYIAVHFTPCSLACACTLSGASARIFSDVPPLSKKIVNFLRFLSSCVCYYCYTYVRVLPQEVM